jgi:glutamate/tyrosine decarboxylase-like PLP-dependent enzyme
MSRDELPESPPFDLPGDSFRRLGYRVVDLMAEILEAERADPILRGAFGETVRRSVDEALPRRGAPPEDVLAECGRAFLDYGRKNGHPRFFGFVCASADPLGALADALASTTNQIVTSWRSAPSATELERLVVRWLDELVGFGGGGGGLLVSGGSAANAHGLACAVARAEEREADRTRMTLYQSREGHMSLAKAARHLGLPAENVRLVGIDARRRLRVDELAARLAEDRAAGLVPVCVAATAGTANTGAVDPLLAVAEVAAENGVWYHVDGAYGAPAVLTEEYRWMSEAFARADSLSLDPHKWLFAPFDVGCVLFRDEEASRRMYSLVGEYAAVSETEPIERYAFFDHGPELSRRFRALKVWMILKVRGVEAIAAVIAGNVALRGRLDARVAAEPRLEPLGSELSITCFRYVPEGWSDGEALNGLNRRILETLNAEGRVYMSPTTLDGRYSLRAAIVNFRTAAPDVDFLVDEVLRLGRAFAA